MFGVKMGTVESSPLLSQTQQKHLKQKSLEVTNLTSRLSYSDNILLG